MPGALAERVVVVAGATRGCGRAIAVELGAFGATVFAVGRTTRRHRSPMDRAETIEDTAELVTAAGGRGIAVRCDCTDPSDVAALRARIESDVDGRLDILVNDVWGGDPFVQFGIPFWASRLDDALRVVRNGVDSHLVMLHALLPLVVRQAGGLVIEVTDGDDETYPGSGIPYYLVKSSVRAIGRALGAELTEHGCVGLTVTPGFLRSEAMLDHFGVTERNWRDAVSKDIPNAADFVLSETPRYLGRGVAALATDPDVSRFAGKTLASWTLMREYGFTDVDGSRPDFGRYLHEWRGQGRDPREVDASRFR